VSERRALTWSNDGKYIYFGIKPQVNAPDTAARNRGTNEVANVDVWNWQDQRIQSQQIGTANADMNFTFRVSFDVAANRFIRLTDSAMRDIDTPRSGRWGIGRDERAYIHDYERPATDFYRVDLATGQRTLILKKQLSFGGNIFGSSPDGKYFLFWKDGHINAFDLDAMTSKPLTKSVPVSFYDAEYDHPGPRPAYGITGFTADNKSVIVNHRYDLWLVPLDGVSAPKNLTNGVGTRGDIRFNYVRTDAAAPGGGGRGGRGGGGGGPIDLTKPALLAAYGQWTKKTGYYELSPSGEMKELVYVDASIGGLQKAAKADRYMFTRQTFAEFPDLQVSGPTFTDAKKITNANPQQSEYKWGKRILFDYKNKKGVRLQGILAVPDDYKPGERRPMIVNFYEKNSQNLHRHQAPSYLSSFNQMPTELLTRGYLLMLPDIHFNTRTSHSDMKECIEAAVTKVIEMGYADPKRVGLHGHSYSGQGAALVGTTSKMFAAVGMGAGVSDMTSDFSHNWGWSYQIGGSGSNAFDYYLYTQGRQGTNPWDDPVLYRQESGRTHVREAVAPFLIMHGTADPTVAFQEGLGMYNAMRFNNKPAVLLAYPGEGHGLGGLANRRDFTIRYMQFFDHFLRGQPAPKWWTDGVAYLDKDGTKDPRE
jgi:dipeptidyl aminopeptidase/acylaminoacyl peptidase